MICLRSLEEKDAPYMLEWMHDINSQACFKKDMSAMTLDQAIDFCKKAHRSGKPLDGESRHFAVVDDANDEYLGTISLKNYKEEANSAEYAISMREKARGTGAAKAATDELLHIGFDEYGLHRVYLTVFTRNVRATKFYEKCGFRYEGELRECLKKDGTYVSLKLYGLLDSDYKKKKGCN